MDDLAANIINRETALANFDHARDDFEAAFARVPDAALGWMPEGDDYTLGDLLPHVIGSITNYKTVLDHIEAAHHSVVGPGWEADPGMAEHNALMHVIYAAGAGRAAIIDELDMAHDSLAARLRDMAYDEYSRATPVHYSGGADPYPTSAHDILGWLTDHYQEHIVQVGQMVTEWEKRASQ